MHTVEKRPENDRNVEEMRNNEEEWNNNMIAEYLNTQRNGIRTVTLSLSSSLLYRFRTLFLADRKHCS